MLVLDELGIIVANLDPDQSAAMPVGAVGAAASGVVSEPEFWCHALGQPVDYLHGYRDAVNSLVGSLLGSGEGAATDACGRERDRDTRTGSGRSLIWFS